MIVRTATISIWLLLTVLSCNVWAEGEAVWRLLQDDRRVSYLLDMTSLGKGGAAIRKLGIRRVFKVPDEWVYAQDVLEIDCLNDLYRFRDITLFDRDDDVVHRYRLTDEFTAIPAASYIAVARRLLCPDAGKD